MNNHWIGLVTAVTTFVGIWFGHVAVRKIEYIAPNIWFPSLVAALAGLLMEGFSLASSDLNLSAALGILGVTLLWDSFEFWRQEKRVKVGHAPANPDNPRHALILVESTSATTLDLLDRDPVGYPLNPDEAIRLDRVKLP